MSSKIVEVKKDEEEKLKKGVCPDCDGDKFLKGPEAGLAVNVQCKNCGSRFNLRWPFTPERI